MLQRIISVSFFMLLLKLTFSQASNSIIPSSTGIQNRDILGWMYSDSLHQIKVYTYMQKTVNMLEMKRKAYNDFLAAEAKGKKGAILWESIKNSNAIGSALILVIEEYT